MRREVVRYALYEWYAAALERDQLVDQWLLVSSNGSCTSTKYATTTTESRAASQWCVRVLHACTLRCYLLADQSLGCLERDINLSMAVTLIPITMPDDIRVQRT